MLSWIRNGISECPAPQKRSEQGVVFMNYFIFRSKAAEMPRDVEHP